MVTPIKLLALDIDGVITDGRASFSPAGEEAKTFSFHDLDAVTLLLRQGMRVALITGEDGPMVEAIARRFGVTSVIAGAKDKLAAVQTLAAAQQVSLDEIAYVGDGDRDAPALAAVGLGLAPANATPAARAAAHRQLSRAGGNGAVAEAVRLIRALEAPDRSAFLPDLTRILRDSLDAHQRLIDGESLPVLGDIAQAFIAALKAGHKLLFFGNGGSAADAQHIAAEFVGRFLRERQPLPALALTTDSSMLTAIGNDWAFEDVFARQVRALVRPGDVVIGISTSGSSPNVLRGLEAGRAGGAVTVGFTGQRGGKMPPVCDVCFCAPADHTPRIQELHILAWHAICEIVEAHLLEPS
jgi:D-sedoheptulose 7-phosphate isomerase